MSQFRKESDSHGIVKVPKNRLWGAQTQRSLKHFSIGLDLMPQEMVFSYAILKKAVAIVNHQQKRLDRAKMQLITKVCDEILDGKHKEEFPLHVWMTGSGTQFNMNMNEVIANRCSQISKKPLGSKIPVHPNDHVNMSQSSNDSFPTAMQIAAAITVHRRLIPAASELAKSIHKKAAQWKKIVKIGRTHLQDATPLTLGQEFSGFSQLILEGISEIKESLKLIYEIPLGGTAVGTGLNTIEGFDLLVSKEISKLTNLPFKTAPNKFASQGSHHGLVILSSAVKTLATNLYKIANDIRLLSSGPRAGFQEILIPANEPGSSIMPGKINPTQCEALCMVAIQAISADLAVTLGGSGGYLEMNVYKPLIIYNLLHSINLLTDSIQNFDRFLIRGMSPNKKQIEHNLKESLMLVTALSPTLGYDKAAKIAHFALEHNLSLKDAALKLKFISEKEFDRLVRPSKMCHPSNR